MSYSFGLIKVFAHSQEGFFHCSCLFHFQIIETTGCTQAQAEIALLDTDNNLYGAIDHILDAGDKLDSWTEQKGAKKEKKKPEEGSYNNRGFVARGRGGGTGFVDRGGRGRSNGAPRESRDNNRDNRDNKEGAAPRSTRGGFEKPYVGRGGRGGARGGYSRAVAPSSALEPDAFTADLDENQTKVDTTVTEVQPPVEESVTATVPTSSAPAPISFAAVAAAAHRKEALRKHQAQNPQPAAPPRRSLSPQPPLPSVAPVKEEPAAAPVFFEPETSHQPEKEDGFFQNESSVLAEEQTPNVSTHHDENVQSTPEPNQAWTTQLKTDLGIGLSEAPGLGLSPIPSAAPVQIIPDPGVEFVGTTAPTNIHDYSFGFVEAAPSPQLPSTESSAASISNASENIFNSSRIMPKQVEPERTSIPNGDYNLKSTSPPLSYGQSNRGLSYDTSSASYQPTDRMAPNKFNNSGPLPTQQSAQQHQPQQQQQQAPQQPVQQQQQTPPAQSQPTGHPQQHPHMMFTQQLPYAPYMNNYMNMYNPMPGVRDEQYTAALMQYGMGVDLTSLLPTAPLSQAASAQQVQSGQQRETHGLMDFNKFGSQSSRDQQPQQASNVGPPPGFQATNYMQQPNLSSLFMQQYSPAPHQFTPFMNMMPNVGSSAGGRQLYGQDDERKSYDKMSGSKPAAQQNQHSQYQHNGGNLGKYGMNKPYNWSN